MANVKSINGNPIVPDSVEDGSIVTADLADGAVTDAKLAQAGGILEYVQDLSNEIDDALDLTVDAVITITGDDIEQGGWSGTSKSSATNRIRLNRAIRVKAGQVIKMVPNDIQPNAFIYTNIGDSTAYYTTGWMTVSREIEVTADGWFLFVARFSNNASITPSDYACDIEIRNEDQHAYASEMARERDGLLNVNWEIGGYAGDTKQTNTGRMRSISTYATEAGKVIGIYLPNSSYRVFVMVTVDGVYQSAYSHTPSSGESHVEWAIDSSITGTVGVRFMLVPTSSHTITASELAYISESVIVTDGTEGGKRLIYRFGGEGNDWCFVRTPSNYSKHRPKPYPFVICNHGNGWVMDGTASKANWTKRTMYVPLDDADYIADPTQYNGTADSSLWYSNPTIEALLAAGYIVCGSENYADNLYGNEDCRKACADFFYHMRRTYNVEERCCMIGASNGAQTSINAAYLLGEQVKAMILQYPLTCLVNQYENYAPHQEAIMDAYGITDIAITEEEFIKATATHDFMNTDITGDVKVGYFPPTKIYYSPDDVVTVASYNALVMYQTLYDSNKITEKVECSGSHGDASHFDPSAYVAWFSRF